MAKARQRTNNQVLRKLADLVDDQHRIVEQRPFMVRESHAKHGQPVAERSTISCSSTSSR